MFIYLIIRLLLKMVSKKEKLEKRASRGVIEIERLLKEKIDEFTVDGKYEGPEILMRHYLEIRRYNQGRYS